jgi:hypothetical protein
MWQLYLNGRLCNGNTRYKKTEEQINQYTSDELKQIAKDNGIKLVSGLTKTELCQAIKDFAEKDKPMIVGPPIVEEPVAAVPVIVRKNSVVEPIEPLNHMNINGTSISSISGPVSFYYFRPTNKFSKLPLIMLFGDRHRARDKMCKKCSCSKQTKSCCYKLSDRPLLELFDTLASEYPVDFYTETSFLGTGTGFANGEMEILTTGDMTSCYHHRLRDTNYNKCPTQNIRWHAGDIRNASYQYYYKYTSQINSNDTLSKYLKTSINYEYSVYVESQLTVIFTMIQRGENITEEDFKQTVFKSFEGFKKFIMILFGSEDGEDEHIFQPYYLHNFARSLFDFGRRSAINKQIEKQSLDELQNRETWVLLYAKSLEKIVETYPDRVKLNIKIEVESTTLENIHEEMKQIFWKIIGDIITPALLDIYVLARMFKKPTEGNVSSLSIGYFGNAHIVNMVYLLSNLGKFLNMKKSKSKYELVARIDKSDNADESKISRCLTMPPIDLNDELFKHNEGI